VALSRRRSRRADLVLAGVDALLEPLAAVRGVRAPRPPIGGGKILVCEFWQLGDAILALPMLRALRALVPTAEIVLLCKGATRALIEPSGVVDRFIVADVPWTAFRGKYAWRRYAGADFAGLVRILRRERFDAAVDARADLRANILLYLSGARRRIGFAAPGGAALLTDRIVRSREHTHRADDWVALLEPFVGGGATIAPSDGIPRLGVAREAVATGNGVTVAIHASASQPVRRWPLQHFEAVVRRLTAMPGVRVMVIVPPEGVGETLAALPGVVVARPSLAELPGVLAECDLLIANDSGPAHIAAAVGTSTVTIFGPQRPEWYAPRGSGVHRVVYREDMACRPCFDVCRFAENFCLTEIAADTVWETAEPVVRGLLAGRGAGC